MPLLFLGTFFAGISSFLGGIYVAHKKTRNVGATTMLAAAINLGVNLAMVNEFGIYAASISTFVSYMFLAFYRMKNIKRFQNINYQHFKLIVAILVIMAMSVICWINRFELNIVNFILGIIVAVVFNMDIIRKAINVVLGKVRKKNDL
jgi:O-antigen/teichoic acid export membrane protein